MKVAKFVPKAVTRQAGRAALKLQKNAPHILFGVGLGGVVGGTVLACRATLKLHDTLDDFKDEVESNKDDATDADMSYIYGKNLGKVVGLYTPALIVGGVGLACLTKSHIQLTKRNTALTVAYTGLAKAYDEYRGRVREEVGEEKELDIFHGAEIEKVVGPDGKKVDNRKIDVNKLSLYSRIFDEMNINWQKDAELNRNFVQCQQNYFNQILQVRGHVFLNEVYENLGFEHSSPGSLVGWTIGPDGDNYISFGMFNADSSRFINGDERSIVLDFNVDGVIWDKI